VAEQADALRRGRPATRRLAADLLGLIASPATRPPLRAALGDEDELVRLSAARGLAELGDEDLGPVAAIADAAVERHGGAVAELVVTLGARRPDALRDLYREARALELRRLVVAAIGELRVGQHADLLREALDAEDSELVARAARALGLLGDVEATDRLVGLVSERAHPWYVRSVATTALGQLGDPAAVPALAAELAEGAQWPERRAAAEALARLGPDGEEALERAMDVAGDGVREHAQAALDRW
jgi:HEAT repeat protein